MIETSEERAARWHRDGQADFIRRAELVAAALEHGHVLIVAHPGTGALGVVRQAVAHWESHAPTDPATRWRQGLAHWLGYGGPFIHPVHRDRQLAELAERFPIGAPLRIPHHTVSLAGLLGTVRPYRPGEITLAHGGVLVLDEWPEFSRACHELVLETMRHGRVRVATSRGIYDAPGPERVIATAAPCPCGYLGHHVRACIDGDPSVARHRARLARFANAPDATVTVLDFTGTT